MQRKLFSEDVPMLVARRRDRLRVRGGQGFWMNKY